MKKICLNLLFLLSFFASAEVMAKSQIKAIIFDCDGTLTDTEPLKFQAWQQSFVNHGQSLTFAEYQKLAGYTSDYILRELSQSKKIALPQSIIKEKEKIYEQLIQSAQKRQEKLAIEGAINYLHTLAKTKEKYGLQLGLASGAKKKEIENNLKQLGLDTVFDKVLSGEEDLKSYSNKESQNKPKPYIYQEMAKQLGVDPKECIVFEDSQAGVIAADLAGCYVVAVPNQVTEQQNFAQADYTLLSWDDPAVKNVAALLEKAGAKESSL